MLKSAFKRVSGGQNIPSVCSKRPCPAGQAEKVGCARLPLAPPAFAVGRCFVSQITFLVAMQIYVYIDSRCHSARNSHPAGQYATLPNFG
jgi:hypothetical protein